MKGSWWTYAVTFIVGAVIAVVVTLLYASSASAKLSADLAGVRTALDKSIGDNRELAGTVSQLHGQLDSAIASAQGLQRQFALDKRRLADQQRIIGGQQSILDAQKRGLDAIAASIAGAGGDIGKAIQAVADGFASLFAIYHASPG